MERAPHAGRRLDPQNTPDHSALQRPLDHFRAKTKRLNIHPAELLLLWIVGLNLVFLPWAMGGAKLWAQLISLGLSLAAFGIALLPRNYTDGHTGGGEFRLHTWPKLLRFPIFWCGLVLFAYILVQAFNPAWQYSLTKGGWWMASRFHYPWLPQGTVTPFAQWNIWRSLIVYAGAWLLVCAIWIGFTRRRSVQFLLIAIAGNGFLIASFGILQRLKGNGRMFWVWNVDGNFFASFIYKNHAGAYLNLALAVVVGLAAWSYLRAQRRLDKSSPSGVFAFFGIAIAIAIVVSYARGSTIVMLAYVVLAVGAFALHQLFSPPELRRPVVLLAMALIFAAFLRLGLQALNAGDAMDKMQTIIRGEDVTWGGRKIATKASVDMLRENWLLGTGTGSFRFLFPKYQQRYPEIFKSGSLRLIWDHAHNDLVEFPVELGLLGMLPILAGLGYWLVALVRVFVWENALSLAIVVGCLFGLASSWTDFPLHNIAVFTTWCALWPCALLWTQFEEMNVKG